MEVAEKGQAQGEEGNPAQRQEENQPDPSRLEALNKTGEGMDVESEIFDDGSV